MDNELKFVFPDKDIKNRFAIWLCDGGAEQAFMDLIMANGLPELDIDYCDANGNFLGDDTVRMKFVEPSKVWECPCGKPHFVFIDKCIKCKTKRPEWAEKASGDEMEASKSRAKRKAKAKKWKK